MKSFIRYFGGTIVRPFCTFESLQSDPHGLARGFRAILIPAVLFTITAGLLAVGGAVLTAPAILPLGGENYYFYQIFFALPVMLAGWAVAAAIVRLFGRKRKGTSSLRGTLAALGFAFGLPALAAWIGQAVFAGLILAGMSQEEFMELTAQPGTLRTVAFAGQAFVVVWLIYLSVAAVHAGLKIRLRAIPVGILAAAIFLGAVLVCLR